MPKVHHGVDYGARAQVLIVDETQKKYLWWCPGAMSYSGIRRRAYGSANLAIWQENNRDIYIARPLHEGGRLFSSADRGMRR